MRDDFSSGRDRECLTNEMMRIKGKELGYTEWCDFRTEHFIFVLK